MLPPERPATFEGLFEQASRDVLEYLSVHVPLSFWAITRVENGRQTYLTVEDSAYGTQPGGSHPWTSSFCISMVAGDTPAVAPDAQAVPAYAAAAINEVLRIGSYAGTAIDDADGTLFGAICGLDPSAQGADLASVEPLLRLLSRMLTMALVADRQREAGAAQVLQAQLAADVDALTGAWTRGAWDRLLAEEDRAYAQRADPVAIVVIDLDRLKETNDRLGHAAGDDLLAAAAEAIRAAVRSQDPVARLGGDEFAVLLHDCTEHAAAVRAEAIRRSLRAAGVEASVGVAAAQPGQGVSQAQVTADRAMYQEKARRGG